MTESSLNAARSPSSPSPARYEEFVRLLGLNQGRVFAFVLTLLPNYADAEEVLQRTSVVLWHKFDEFEPVGDFVRWACGVAHLETLAFLRLRRRERLVFGEEVLEKIAAERLARQEVLSRRRTALDVCLQKLGARDRQIVEQYYFHDRATASDVAQSLGRPVDTIYKALARIRDRLHHCIDRTLAVEEHR
jgi:RNA polymerase sigma-70 factor, ECF subfamily